MRLQLMELATMAWQGQHLTTSTPDVVVLCNHPEVANLLWRWLGVSKVSSLLAHSGYEARSALHTTSPQILITDRVVPPWPGLGSVRRLKAEYAFLEVAYIDASAQEPVILARFCGADRVLTWPLRHEIVMHWLESHISAHRHNPSGSLPLGA